MQISRAPQAWMMAGPALLLALFGFVSPGLAHSGHDHGPSVEISASVAPRFSASSDDFEMLAVLTGAQLTITLDRFRSNEPVTDAKIDATVNGIAVAVTPKADGTYTLSSAELGRPGRAEVVFTVQAGPVTDLLAGALEVSAAATAPRGATAWWQRLALNQEILIAAVAGLMSGVLGMLLFAKPGQRRADAQVTLPAAGSRPRDHGDVDHETATRDKKKLRAVSTAMVVGVAVSVAALSAANGPADAAEPAAKTITITADLPQRLPDGTLFVPKVTQRLLSIRTVLAGESAAGSTIELNGQIISDPNGFGRVQAAVDGRVDAPPVGLVVVGQRVERGQTLAVLTPIVPTADRSVFESTLGEIDTRIALAETKLSRITRIAGVIAQKDIDDTRTELETLKTRRTAVRASGRETLTLTAPISGVVSLSTAVPGQIATARETLFEIVDPARLWVEAIAYDARLVADITAARAIDPTGDVLTLDYLGRGISARQQGVPLNFSIMAPPSTLVIGKPVTVLLTTKDTRQGLILPQAAVVKGQNGLSIVWTHTQAERFKPNVVKVRPIDGQRLLVEGGLAANERVVIDGATLLNQVR